MIEVLDLCYRYEGSMRDAVRNVTFSLEPAGITAILGANGSGKSTLALLLAGLLVPTSGSVSVDGIATDSPERRRAIRRKVGLLFQDPHSQFTSPSVERELAFGLQNMEMHLDDMKACVDEYLHTFDLEACRTCHPSDLSGGEQQRLAIASALIGQPRYLILDEPTSLLAPRSKQKLLAMTSSMRNDVGILLITHSPSDARHADRIIVLQSGEMKLVCPPLDLFSHTPLLERSGIAVPLAYRSRS